MFQWMSIKSFRFVSAIVMASGCALCLEAGMTRSLAPDGESDMTATVLDASCRQALYDELVRTRGMKIVIR